MRVYLLKCIDMPRWFKGFCLFILLQNCSFTGDQPIESRVENYMGKPTIIINHKPEAPVFYALTDIPGGRWSWEEMPQHNIQQFCEHGIRLFQLDLSLQEMVHQDGTLDMTMAKKQVEGVKEVCPSGVVFFRLHLNPPQWWLDQYPEAIVGYDSIAPAEELTIGQSRLLEADARNPRRASMASQVWKDWATKYLTLFCESFANTEAGKAVGGIQLAYGIYGEWHQWGLHQYEADFSASMTKYFQDWLQQKYDTDEVLQTAWRQPNLRLDQVVVPNTARRSSTTHGIFRDPTTNREVIDYYQCQHELVADLIIHFSEVVHQQWPRPIIKGVFYGYFFSMFNRQAAAGHLALQKVLAAPTIDYLSGPQVYYPDAGFNPGEPYRSRSLLQTMNINGKLWLDEYDQQPRRTWPYLSIQDNREKYAHYLQENTALLKRSFLFPILQGHGLWFYDFGPAGMHLHPRNQWNSQSGTSGYWDHPVYMDTIARLKAFADQFLQEQYHSNAEVLAVYDTESIYYMPSTKAHACPITEHLINESTLALYHTGKLFDQIHLEDLNKVNLDQYRVVLFMNTFVLTPQQRTYIKDSVATNNRHLVWAYAPGIINEHKWGLDLATAITGIQLKVSTLKGHPTLSIDHAFADVCPLQMKEAIDPLIVVADTQAISYGHFNNGEIGMARKDLQSATSWYSSLPITNDTIYRVIFKEAGCQPSLDHQAIVLGSSGWRLIHKNDAQGKEVTSRLMKLDSGDFIPVSLPPPILSSTTQ